MIFDLVYNESAHGEHDPFLQIVNTLVGRLRIMSIPRSEVDFPNREEKDNG